MRQSGPKIHLETWQGLICHLPTSMEDLPPQFEYPPQGTLILIHQNYLNNLALLLFTFLFRKKNSELGLHTKTKRNKTKQQNDFPPFPYSGHMDSDCYLIGPARFLKTLF